MSGAALHADFTGLKKMAEAISRFESVDRRRILDAMGATAVSQTQRRIQEDKSSPEGVAWKPWSKRYAKTRHEGQSLLIGTGALVSGLTHNVLSDHEVEWGSPEIYARIQQEGGDIEMLARGQYAHMLKDEKTGRNRFVKAGTEGAKRKGIDIAAHTIHIEARPFLGVSDANAEELESVCAGFMERAAGELQ